MRHKEREKWITLLREERERSDEAQQVLLGEIRKLVDRVQHPEIKHVEPIPDYTPPELPKDFAELAHVGEEVPEFVNVGSADKIKAEEAEIARVGEIEEN